MCLGKLESCTSPTSTCCPVFKGMSPVATQRLKAITLIAIGLLMVLIGAFLASGVIDGNPYFIAGAMTLLSLIPLLSGAYELAMPASITRKTSLQPRNLLDSFLAASEDGEEESYEDLGDT